VTTLGASSHECASERSEIHVSPTDPIVFTDVSLVLVAVGLLACVIPARRAASTNPMEALRDG